MYFSVSSFVSMIYEIDREREKEDGDKWTQNLI